MPIHNGFSPPTRRSLHGTIVGAVRSLTPALVARITRNLFAGRLRRARLVLFTVILASAATGIALVGTGVVGGDVVAVAAVTSAVPPATGSGAVGVPDLAPAPAIVADAVVPAVQLYSSPGVAWEGTKPFTNPTPQGEPLVFLVHEQQGEWLHVQVSARPNGLMAWVRAADVHLRADPYRIVVSLSGHSVTLYRGDTSLLSAPAVVGRPASPTPTGSFFVDAIIPLSYDSGPYGAGAMGVAAFSDVYQTFGGGPGQIAIHGTNEPSLLGQSASHGCVRIANDEWRKITAIVPTGTPVQINS